MNRRTFLKSAAATALGATASSVVAAPTTPRELLNRWDEADDDAERLAIIESLAGDAGDLGSIARNLIDDKGAGFVQTAARPLLVSDDAAARSSRTDGATRQRRGRLDRSGNVGASPSKRFTRSPRISGQQARVVDSRKRDDR